MMAAGSMLVLLSSLLTNVIYSKSPLSFRFYEPMSGSCYKHLYVITPHARKIPQVVRSVPRDKRVCASLFIATRFTHHAAVCGFPEAVTPGTEKPVDYIVLDLEERWLLDSPGQRDLIERLKRSPDFERVPAPQGFLVLRRMGHMGPMGRMGEPSRSHGPRG
jgi:hypothetical protein